MKRVLTIVFTAVAIVLVIFAIFALGNAYQHRKDASTINDLETQVGNCADAYKELEDYTVSLETYLIELETKNTELETELKKNE